ncbi:MAG: NTP transferase domain-containing protein, partial [Chloroflexi bacterium]|nr:NTP transferase domain-containing protein [Chloroflexota bacterium]
MNLAIVILAAGQGTRLKSNQPKVLHRIAGKAMVHYALDAARALNATQTILVIGHGAEQVRSAVSKFQIANSNFHFVEQRDQLGTGHAVLQTRAALRAVADTILVTYADMPLLQTATLKEISARHAQTR